MGGDVDLAVEFTPRRPTHVEEAKQRAAQSGKKMSNFLQLITYGTYEIRQILKNRSPYLSIHEYGEPEQLGVPFPGAVQGGYQNGDWETHVMFWRRRELYGEKGALESMAGEFNDEYPKKGMVFALGNQAKRPQTWQLLGVIRLDELTQGELFG